MMKPIGTTSSPSLARRRFFGRALAFLGGMALPWRVGRSDAAPQSTEPFIGEVQIFAGAYAPRHWALCNGQLLPINQYQALFSLLGTTYGGNGVTTFALPDLRGRVAVHRGQGPGLSNRVQGERSGAVSHALALSEMPAHAHVARASSADAVSADPSASVVPARSAAGIPHWAPSADTMLAPGVIGIAGGGQSHENRQPFLALNYIIALQGIYPPQ
jgi:microcystin-dependent protein